MNEYQRMQYLDAMGIDTYVPRVLLPAAKVSEQLYIPKVEAVPVGEAQSPVVEPEVSVRSSAGPQRVSIDLDSVLAGASGGAEPSADDAKKGVESDKEPVKAEVTLKSLARGDVPQSQTDAVRFSLALWRVGDWQIIDSRRQGDALPTDRLLANMLQQLGKLDVNLPRVEILNWPAVENKANQGWPEARALVQGFLDGRILAKPVSHFILMGQDAAHAVLGEELNFLEKQHTTQAVSDFNAKALVLPSLSDLLYAPHLKRDTWLSLSAVLS
ncbi:MAG: hypothetical protein K6L76_14430 [Agarilytica sp.]